MTSKPGRSQLLLGKRQFNPNSPSEIHRGLQGLCSRGKGSPPPPPQKSNQAQIDPSCSLSSPEPLLPVLRHRLGDITWHAKETACHGQLGCLRKVGKHGAGRGGDATLQSALGLWSLRKRRTKMVARHGDRPAVWKQLLTRAAARGWRISRGFWPVHGKHSLQTALVEVRNRAAESRAVPRAPPPDSMGLTGNRSEGEGVGEKTTSSYGLCWHKETGCRGLGLKAALQSLGKRAARSQNCCKREGSRILAPPSLSGSACCAHPTPKQEHASGLQVRGSMLLLCWEPSTGATEKRAPLTCRSVWCRMMFSCLLTLETAGAAVGDKAACCCSLCSIS